ncbi:MAG: Toxin transporter ATPase and permease [Gammaproteobacteria bacterium]|jgi:ATP-binding cassette subfamily C protein LapB|nr:Toxin transporter ATPase and permease [Gammaproteobacteria bacterium]
MDKDTSNYHYAEEDVDDPLLACLLVLTKLRRHPYSRDALVAGLPLRDNKLTPDLFWRAAERAGLYSKLICRQLSRISPLVLPCVLILKSGHACVLTALYDDGNADVIFPETNDVISSVPISNLEESYTGYVFFIKEMHGFESRADEYNIGQPKKWFWGTLTRYNRIYFRVIITVLLINIFALATPLFVMNVYDRVVPNNATDTLWVMVVGIMTVLCFDFLLKILRGYFIDTAGKKADISMASNIFQHVMGLKLASKPKSSGAFANNLREFEVLRDFFTSATMATLVDLPFLLLFVFLMFIIGGKIAIFTLIAVPVVFLVALLLELPMRREVSKDYIGATQKHAVLVEAINNIELIKSMGAEGTIQQKWESSIAASAQSGRRSRKYSTIAGSFTAFMQQFVTVGTVVYGVYLIQEGSLTIGGLIACSILAGRAIAPLAQMTSVLLRYQQSRVALENLNKIMALPIERPSEMKFIRRPHFDGSIQFEKVSFKYPGTRRNAIEEVSFKIEHGERVGLVGSIGSGKTTLQKLILQFYPPDDGNILLDGVDIAQIDPADLRRNIGYVPQEQQLMYGTIRDNIAMRMPWASDEMVLSAATTAGVDQFLSRNPAGYQLSVGERGDGLSGGQRQAIMVARGILGSPPILLLDEPTSSMDNRTEQLVMKALFEYIKGKTVILITHKLAMLAMVDRLILLDKGRVVADGPKDKVLEALAQNKVKPPSPQGGLNE